MMLLTLYGMPTSLTILKLLIMVSFVTGRLTTSLRNLSLPCSIPKEIRAQPISLRSLNFSYVTVSIRVWHQKGNPISRYISANSSNSPGFHEKNVSAQKYKYSRSEERRVGKE